MKKFFALLLLVTLLLGLIGCGSGSAAPAPETGSQTSEEAPTAQTRPVTVQTQPVTVQTQPVTVQTQPPAGEEEPLYLKVSAITFSLVEEQEDIYLGMAPRELVTWESEDPSVVSVENGVLTANAVGTTTIHASYADQQLSVTAGCLAQTQEELESLGFEVLCQPKHVLPEVDLETPCTFFDNMALVGDSISYMMLQCESKGNYLGDLLFLARGGTSLNGFVMRTKNLYFKGAERYLEDAIAESGVERMYILIGSNDIASEPQRDKFMDNWEIMVTRIREKSPDVEIAIISNIPQYADAVNSNSPAFREYNKNVLELNEQMRIFCQEKDCIYFDLYYYIQDHCGRMPRAYNLDGYHLNDEGYKTWMQIMRYYAQFELEGGTIS